MYKILFAGDLHKRPKDISTIEGYCKCTNAVQISLMRKIMELGVTHFVSLGDWYDKGYASDIASALSHTDIDIQMNKILKGNFYGCIGNHIRLHMDSNPELYLIQPHDKYKSRHRVLRTEQIIKTPDKIILGPVQISLMHHNMNANTASDYTVPKRDDGIKYHIAVFHTPAIIPNQQLTNTQFSYNSSPTSMIAKAVEDVDLAIVGDIHIPLGSFDINTTRGVCRMVVPGSLTNTESSTYTRHNVIALPLVTINDDDSIKLEFVNFDLQTNLVTFKQKNNEEHEKKLKSLRGNTIKSLNDTESVASLLAGGSGLGNLNDFMSRQGYTPKDKKLIRSVINAPNDIGALAKIYYSEEE